MDESDIPAADNFQQNTKGPEHEGGTTGAGKPLVPVGSTPHRIIPLDQLQRHIEEQKQNSNAGFASEFESVSNGDHGTYHAAQSVPASLNRYYAYWPYDRNRVIIEDTDPSPFSHYINASYMKVGDHADRYIAAQGPVLESVDNFWRMVWETNTNVVLMLTCLVHNDKVKCERYWPVDSPATYGRILVKPTEVQTDTDFTRRTFRVIKDNEEREVTQYHYEAWPDLGVPTAPTGLLRIMQIVQGDAKPGKRIICHCSAGAGRTGSYLAITQLLDQAPRSGTVDVPATVHALRSDRIKIVETLEQYRFIYEAVAEALLVNKY